MEKRILKTLRSIAKRNEEYLRVEGYYVEMEDSDWYCAFLTDESDELVKAVFRILKSKLRIKKKERKALKKDIWDFIKQNAETKKQAIYVITGDNAMWRYHAKIDFNEFYNSLTEDEKDEMIYDFLFGEGKKVDEIARWLY